MARFPPGCTLRRPECRPTPSNELLGYLTWRDTHAELIVFVRKGSPADIETTAIAELEAHEAYKRTIASHGRSLYTVANDTDPTRELHLALRVIPVLP